MARQWFRVRTVDDTIKGWHRSPKATVLPSPPAGVAFFDATDIQIEEFTSLQGVASRDGRDTSVLYNDGILILPDDNRFFVDVTVDPAHQVAEDEHAGEIAADGIDTAVITFTKLKSDGTTQLGFNKTINTELFSRVIRLVFVAGVATKNLKTRKSEVTLITSDVRARLKTPFVLTSVTVGDIEDA